jgi:hypothetical protein
MPTDDYQLSIEGIKSFIRKEKDNFIYSINGNFRYNNADNKQYIEGKGENSEWMAMRTYCIPPYKNDYGNDFDDYYQVVRKNLEFIFDGLERMRETANTAVITKEISDACYIADNILTFISAQKARIGLGFENNWADIHSITEVFTDAAEAGKEKTIEVTTGSGDDNSYNRFIARFKDLFDLAGDYFAIDRPAWDATMKKINKKLNEDDNFSKSSVKKVVKEMDTGKNLGTTDFNPEVLKYGLKMLVFYKKEIVLNTISAEIMYGFMLRGLTLIENVKNLALTPRSLDRVLRGFLNILVAPEVGSKVKEMINDSGETIIETIKNGEVPDFSENLEISSSVIDDIFHETIKNHNLVDKFGPVKNIYSYYEEEIKSEKESQSENYGFFAVHKIDSPNISLGAKILIEDFSKYIIPKAFNKIHKLISGNDPGFMKKVYRTGVNYERALDTIEEYNTDQLDFNGVKRIVSDLEGIKKLYDYRDNDNLAFVAVYNINQEKIKNEMKSKVKDALFTFYDPFELDIEDKSSAKDHSDYFYCNKPEEEYYLRLYEGDEPEHWENFEYTNQEFKQIANKEKQVKIVEQVKKLKKHFPKEEYSYIYRNDRIRLVVVTFNRNHNDDPHYDGYRHMGNTSDYYYNIVFKSLDKIAQFNGAKKIEMERGRLKQGEKITKQDWFTMSDFYKINRKSDQKNYSSEILPLAYRISPDQDFIILYQDRDEIEGNNLGTTLEPERLKDIKFPEYKSNDTTFYGSANKEEEITGKQEKFELQLGTKYRFRYRKKPKEKFEESRQLISNPDGKILINGKGIGQNLERQLAWENLFDAWQKQQKYRETIDYGENNVLDLKYTYDLNGGYYTLFKKTDFPFLKIEYKCRPKEKNDQKRDFQRCDRLIIKEFDAQAGDYGIKIPDKIVVKPGFKSQHQEEKEGNEKIKIEEHDHGKSHNKSGKLIIDGNPVSSKGLEENEREAQGYVVFIVRGAKDYLGNVAQEWLGSSLRWQELEKEPGQCFSEGEQHTLQLGTKVYISKEKIRKYNKVCKICRWSLLEEVVEYIHQKMMNNLESEVAKCITEKLKILDQERTWHDLLNLSDDFKEVGKGYYKWYQLVKTGGDWDYEEYIGDNYSRWSCDLLNKEKYPTAIWSNIHYGYLGLAVGFKKEELLNGAGIAQVKEGFDNLPEGYFKRIFEEIGDTDFLAALDDPKDQESIKIGFELWESQGEDLTVENIIEIIRNRSEDQIAKEECTRR